MFLYCTLFVAEVKFFLCSSAFERTSAGGRTYIHRCVNVHSQADERKIDLRIKTFELHFFCVDSVVVQKSLFIIQSGVYSMMLTFMKISSLGRSPGRVAEFWIFSTMSSPSTTSPKTVY